MKNERDAHFILLMPCFYNYKLIPLNVNSNSAAYE